MAHWTYNGATPVLQLGEFTILSAEDTQQGDPLSSAEFCLATHPLFGGLISELNVGNHVDVTLSGPRQIFVDDIKTIISKSEELGLEMNAVKCNVSCRDKFTRHDDLILETIQRVEIEDLILMGTPILAG